MWIIPWHKGRCWEKRTVSTNSTYVIVIWLCFPILSLIPPQGRWVTYLFREFLKCSECMCLRLVWTSGFRIACKQRWENFGLPSWSRYNLHSAFAGEPAVLYYYLLLCGQVCLIQGTVTKSNWLCIEDILSSVAFICNKVFILISVILTSPFLSFSQLVRNLKRKGVLWTGLSCNPAACCSLFHC